MEQNSTNYLNKIITTITRISDSSKNLTNLLKSNGKNSAITLENKTVNYFDNTNSYLVYPT